MFNFILYTNKKRSDLRSVESGRIYFIWIQNLSLFSIVFWSRISVVWMLMVLFLMLHCFQQLLRFLIVSCFDNLLIFYCILYLVYDEFRLTFLSFCCRLVVLGSGIFHYVVISYLLFTLFPFIHLFIL